MIQPSMPRKETFAKPRGLLALVATVCVYGTVSAALPPIADPPTGRVQPGSIVWIDLLTDDPAKAKAFYSATFGWQIDATAESDYWLIRSGGKAIGGIAAHTPTDPEVSETQWLISMSVADVNAAAKRARDAGGRVLEGPENVPDRGAMAIIADPQGAPLIVLRAKGGDPGDSNQEHNSWAWAELWARDTGAAAAFYRDLVGYTAKTTDDDGTPYTVLGSNGQVHAGIVELPWDDVQPNWLSYVAVENIRSTVRDVEANGGYVLLAPAPEYDDGRVAIVSDPTGGVFAVYEWRDGQ